jgi:hypothetical protein
MDDEKYIKLASDVIKGRASTGDILDDYMYKDNIIKLLQTKKRNEETDELEDVDKNEAELRSFYSSARQLSNFIAKKKLYYQKMF